MWTFLETSIKSGTSETDMAQHLYSMTAATTLTKVKKTMSAVWFSVLVASRPRQQAICLGDRNQYNNGLRKVKNAPFNWLPNKSSVWKTWAG